MGVCSFYFFFHLFLSKNHALSSPGFRLWCRVPTMRNAGFALCTDASFQEHDLSRAFDRTRSTAILLLIPTGTDKTSGLAPAAVGTLQCARVCAWRTLHHQKARLMRRTQSKFQAGFQNPFASVLVQQPSSIDACFLLFPLPRCARTGP